MRLLVVLAMVLALSACKDKSDKDVDKDIDKDNSDTVIITKPEKGKLTRKVGGTDTIDAYTYKPACANPKLLITFHGTDRNASEYRDWAVRIADRECLLVFAPHFTESAFPNWRYHRAGVYDGGVKPESEWTKKVYFDVLSWAVEWSGKPNIYTAVFGHSAGGQFLSRSSAYFTPKVSGRIVITNPSAHVWPSLDERVPYGFGGIFNSAERTERLKSYLALPITIYVGSEDTGTNLLDQSAPANRQGPNRYERGKNVFVEAQKLAWANGWQLNWELVIAPGVGHTSSGMLNSSKAPEALGLR